MASKARARKPSHRQKRRPPASHREALAREADALLRQAGEQRLAYRGEYEAPDGSSLLAQAAYMVPLSPTDKPGEDQYDQDRELVVIAEPDPQIDNAVAGKPAEVSQEKVLGVIERGPNGRRCILVEGQRIKEWNHVSMQEYEAPSRAREWVFRGHPDVVNEVERRLILTGFYFRRWLREARPRMSERMIERSARIAEYYIAESSACLVYRGRYVSPERRATERPPSRWRRPALAATAAAYRVSPATVERSIRDLGRFRHSALYRDRAALYDRNGIKAL